MKKRENLRDVLKRKLQPADPERKPEKMYKPPGSGKRKAGAAFLWLLFTAAFIMSLGSYLTVINSQDDDEVEVVENKTDTPEGIEFAKQFASVYFSWKATGEGMTERAEKLAPMMSETLDDNAGLQVGDIEWNSSLSSARVVKTEPVGEQKALITLAIKQSLSKGDDKETNETLFTVPVEHAKAFGVYDLPSFAAMDTTNEVAAAQLPGTPVASEVEQNVKAFLTTFFQSYAADTPDKLSYFLEDVNNSKGLEGAFDFVEVKDALILENTGTYNVDAEVLFLDAKTDIKYAAAYRMTITEENGRYIVSTLKGGL